MLWILLLKSLVIDSSRPFVTLYWLHHLGHTTHIRLALYALLLPLLSSFLYHFFTLHAFLSHLVTPPFSYTLFITVWATPPWQHHLGHTISHSLGFILTVICTSRSFITPPLVALVNPLSIFHIHYTWFSCTTSFTPFQLHLLGFMVTVVSSSYTFSLSLHLHSMLSAPFWRQHHTTVSITPSWFHPYGFALAPTPSRLHPLHFALLISVQRYNLPATPRYLHASTTPSPTKPLLEPRLVASG